MWTLNSGVTVLDFELVQLPATPTVYKVYFNKLLLLNEKISVYRLSERNKNKKNIVPRVCYLLKKILICDRKKKCSDDVSSLMSHNIEIRLHVFA